MTINETMLPLSAARCGKKLRAFAGVTIHETGNTAAGATANSHLRYMRDNGGKNKEVSYHYVVDDKEAYHLIPNDEVAWHAGDGAAGKGNNETLAIEICVNAGGDFPAAAANAAVLAAALLHEKGVHKTAEHIFEHHDWSPWGKNCPAQLRAGKAGGMAALRAAAQQKLDELWSAGSAQESVQKTASPEDGQKTNAEQSKEGLWKVQVGAFASRTAAQRYAGQLRQSGYSAFATQN